MSHDLELQNPNATREAAELRELAVLAKIAPRDEKRGLRELLKLARSWEWAEKVTYTVDDREEGAVLLPSVWFARPFAAAWGHVHRGFRVTHSGFEFESLEGWAFDAQAVNMDRVAGELRKVVKRRETKDGKVRYVEHRLDDEELLAARHRAGAILVRRALLNVLPAKPVRLVMAQCEATLEKHHEAAVRAGLLATVPPLLAAWARQGVTRDDLEAHLGHPLEQMTGPASMRLAGMLRAVEQGAISVASVFARAAAEQEARPAPCEAPALPPLRGSDWTPPPETAPALEERFWSNT